MSSIRVLALALGLVVLLVCGRARAHGQRIAYVDVDEVTAGSALAHMRLSVAAPSIELSIEGCTTRATGGAGRFDRSLSIACPGPLRGRAITVRGLGPVVDEAVVSVRLVDGARTTELARPGTPTVLGPGGASRLALASRYVRLGAEHIAAGLDHLLLLALLVLALRSARAVLIAETAFTLSHTLSFGATAVGLVRVSPRAAEVCIALSLVLLALDVPRAHEPSMPAGRGAVTALVFGLVHGLGFAGGLFELGVPDDAAGTAILGFGAGVELGQLAFLALALGATSFAARAARWSGAQAALVTTGGAASVYWLLERGAALWFN